MMPFLMKQYHFWSTQAITDRQEYEIGVAGGQKEVRCGQ